MKGLVLAVGVFVLCWGSVLAQQVDPHPTETLPRGRSTLGRTTLALDGVQIHGSSSLAFRLLLSNDNLNNVVTYACARGSTWIGEFAVQELPEAGPPGNLEQRRICGHRRSTVRLDAGRAAQGYFYPELMPKRRFRLGVEISEGGGPRHLIWTEPLSLRDCLRTPSSVMIAERPALQVAAVRADSDTIVRLIEAGADPNVADAHWLTAMHLAALLGHVEVCEALLVHGADLNAASEVCHTPLVLAARYNRIEVVKRLLEWGADPDAVPRIGTHSSVMWEAIHIERRTDDDRLMQILMRSGAH